MTNKPSARTLIVFSTAALVLCLLVLLPDAALAEQYAGHGLGSTGGVSGLGEFSGNLPSLIGRIINALLGLVSVVFLVLMIYAGFLWMTAGGNEEQVKKAKNLIIGTIIGAAIIFAAYAITIFVVDAIAPPGASQEAETVGGEDPLEGLIQGAIEGECTGEHCSDIEGL